MNNFLSLQELLKNPNHKYYRIYYLKDMHKGWTMLNQEFWSISAAQARLDSMRKNRRYHAVKMTFVDEVIVE